MNNRVLLGNRYLSGELETCVAAFVDYYNHERYHDRLDRLIPADV